jgi:RNA polymerase sigma-70 factor (ECF subfamily)
MRLVQSRSDGRWRRAGARDQADGAVVGTTRARWAEQDDQGPEGTADVTAAPITLESLFRSHFDDVYRMVGRLLGPGARSADIEDVTQLVFLAAHRALPKFRGESKVTTWLYGIAVRVVLTQLRAWRRHRRLKSALEHEPGVMLRAVSPDETVAQRQELVRVWSCLMKIKPEKRVVYVLHEVEGLPGAEIAAALGIPVATVWTRLFHARKELNRALARLGAE